MNAPMSSEHPKPPKGDDGPKIIHVDSHNESKK